MLSTIFEVIGFLTVFAVISVSIMTYMGWVVMCAGHDDEDGLSMFGFCWGFEKEDEYL